MKCDLLFDKVRSIFPNKISLSDPNQNDQGHYYFHTVSDAHEAAIENIAESDHWLIFGAWSLSQAIWEIADWRYRAGEIDVSPADIPMERFDQWMRLNLSDDETTSEEYKEYLHHNGEKEIWIGELYD